MECKKVRYRRVIIYFSLTPLNVGFSKMKCCEFLARTNQTPSFFDNRSMKLEFIYTSNTIQLHEQFFPTYFLDILMMECHMYVWHGVFCFLIFKHSIFRKQNVYTVFGRILSSLEIFMFSDKQRMLQLHCVQRIASKLECNRLYYLIRKGMEISRILILALWKEKYWNCSLFFAHLTNSDLLRINQKRQK